MKLLVITLVFIFNQISFATEVIGDGYGADFNESLRNAKINALEQIIGTFIIAESWWSTDDEKIFEKIKTYHGGYIEKYSILESSSNYVKIRATINDDTINSISIKGDEINVNEEILNKYHHKKERAEFFREFDNPSQAFNFQIESIDITPDNYGSTFSIKYKLNWNDYWISNFKQFIKINSNEGQIETDTSEQIVNTVLFKIAQVGLEPLVAATFMVDSFTPKKIHSDEPMYCFTKNDGNDIQNCYSTNLHFQKMPLLNEFCFEIIGLNEDGQVLFAQKAFISNLSLYEIIYPNTQKDMFFYKRKFYQPTFLINANEEYASSIKTRIESERFHKIKKFKLIPVGNF